MAKSLVTAARAVGYGAEEVNAVSRAFDLAMKPRIATLEDDHHPAYLHPGRSVLILLHDVGYVDLAALIIAAILESVDVTLRVGHERLETAVDGAILAALGAIPAPGDERLIERLVVLGPGAALATLAERLDHLRHLHLREDLIDSWADTHQEVLGAWLPFAQRTDSKLATRYAHWARTFGKRI